MKERPESISEETARLRAENARLRAFAEAVRDIALRPIEASDAMDEIDDLVCGCLAIIGTKDEPRATNAERKS